MQILGINKFNFEEIESHEITSANNLIIDLFEKNKNGAIIKQVLSPNELKKIQELTINLTETEYQITGSGFTFPIPFANVKDEQSKEEYIAKKALYNSKTTNELGFNINEKVKTIINQLSGNLIPTEPKFKQSNNQLASASQIRYLKENMGGLSAHTGNYFQNMFQFFYNELDENIGKFDQLSYFFLIQKPLVGGDLIVYDITWEEAQTKPDFETSDYLTLLNGKTVSFDSIGKSVISLMPGDLFIFRGGEIWHRVEEIIKKDRITIGGFMSKSKISNQLFLWA